MSKHMIWNNDVEAMLESLEGSGEPMFKDLMETEGRYQVAADEVMMWREDERCNLNQKVGDLVCFAEIQRWNGRFSAYKELASNILGDILLAITEDASVEYYVDGNEVRAEAFGHDNPVTPSVYTFRAWKKTASKAHREQVLSAFYQNTANKWDLADLYTDPLGRKVAKIYGFAMA